ncbi:hypothetical protein J7E67_20245 [Bacillus sp. ISL-46]|nr:hypothetical protein [Bacillus sp. ISL-46]
MQAAGTVSSVKHCYDGAVLKRAYTKKRQGEKTFAVSVFLGEMNFR